jgi:uncharacterized membrane protein YbhN (UPF0104 family)
MPTESGESKDAELRPEPSPKRKYLWAIGVTFYIVVIWFVGWDRLTEAVRGAALGPLAAMIALMATGQVLRALKWRFALGPGQHAFRAFAVSKAGGEWSPGRVGEFAPLMIARHRSTRVAAWIVADRVFEMAATLGIGLAGLLLIRTANRGYMLAAVLGVLMLVVLGLVVLTRRKWLGAIARRMPPDSRRRRYALILVNISEELLGFARVAPFLFAITLVAGAIDLAVGYALYLAFGFAVPVAVLAATKGLHAVTSAIPITPNATGIPYLAAAALLHEVGGVSTGALAAAVGISVITSQLVLWSSFGLAAFDGEDEQTN